MNLYLPKLAPQGKSNWVDVPFMAGIAEPFTRIGTHVASFFVPLIVSNICLPAQCHTCLFLKKQLDKEPNIGDIIGMVGIMLSRHGGTEEPTLFYCQVHSATRRSSLHYSTSVTNFLLLG